MASYTATFRGNVTSGLRWYRDPIETGSKPIRIDGCELIGVVRKDGVKMPEGTTIPSQAVITGFRIQFASAEEKDSVSNVGYSVCSSDGLQKQNADMDAEYGISAAGFYLTARDPNSASLRKIVLKTDQFSFYFAPYIDAPSDAFKDLFYVGSASVTVVVTYINDYAASTGTLSTNSVEIDGVSGVYLTINNQCTQGFYDKVTHQIVWSIPAYNYSYTQEVDAVNEKTFTTSNYIVPESLIASNMANTPNATMSVQLRTYRGTALIQPVQNFTLEILVPESIRPTLPEEGLSLTRFHDTALNNLLLTYRVQEEDIGCVQEHDGVTVLADGAAGAEGSTITDYVFIVSGKTYTQSVSDANFNAAISKVAYANAVTTGTVADAYVNVYKIPLVRSAYDISVMCYVVDSRGRKSISRTIKIPVTAYSIPAITEASSIRCDAEGTALENGLYARASATSTYSRLTVVKRDSSGNIIYTTDEDDNLVPTYQNLNTVELTVAFGWPTYDPAHVDEDGNPIPVWTWISPEDDVIGTPLSPSSGSKVVGDGNADHVVGIRILANDYFTSDLDISAQPMEIVFTTSSEYVIFFREGGTGVSFGQALSAEEDNRFVVAESWSMLHGDQYIPSIIISPTVPRTDPATTLHLLWLKPDDTDTVGNWMGCKVYVYNP